MVVEDGVSGGRDLCYATAACHNSGDDFQMRIVLSLKERQEGREGALRKLLEFR